MATRVLAVAAPELTPPRPVRRTGRGAPHGRRWRVPDGPTGPPRGAGRPGGGRWRPSEVAAVAPGRVAVLAPEACCCRPWPSPRARPALPVVDARDMRRGGLAEPLVLLAADAANGLEFDAVVVVEPAVIAGETARGLRTLYVALTRPTQRLDAWCPLAPPPPAGADRRRRQLGRRPSRHPRLATPDPVPGPGTAEPSTR